MSIGLTLIILNSPEEIGAAINTALVRTELPVRMRVISSLSMKDQIADRGFVSHQVPKAFSLDSRSAYGNDSEEEARVTTDAYDKPLRYCYREAFTAIVLDEDEHPFNKATLAFVLALPDDWPIV